MAARIEHSREKWKACFPFANAAKFQGPASARASGDAALFVTRAIGSNAADMGEHVATAHPATSQRDRPFAPKAMLKADRDNRIIRLDAETRLSEVPNRAWAFGFGVVGHAAIHGGEKTVRYLTRRL